MSPEAECRRDDVVVTGLGTINPLGADVKSTWSALNEGTCAVRTLEHEWVGHHELPVRIGAPLAVDPAEMLPPRQMRRLDRASQCALLAARQAWEQAEAPQVAPQRLAVSVSPGMGPVLSVMEAWDTLRDKGPRRVLPTAVPALMPNAPAAAVGIELGAHGGIHAPVSACASGAEAIAYGADLIALGRADVVVAGGTDSALHPMTVAAFGAMRALSTRNDDPQTASRPFAPDRDGFVLGEGAGLLVLERRAPGSLPTPTTSHAPSHRVRSRNEPCDWLWIARALMPAPSGTSTPTPPRHPPATSSRPVSWPGRFRVRRSAPRSPPPVTSWAGPGAWRRC